MEEVVCQDAAPEEFVEPCGAVPSLPEALEEGLCSAPRPRRTLVALELCPVAKPGIQVK